MLNQERGFRLDAKTLSRITGGAAVLFGMSQIGGDAPHSYSPETFSNRPGMTQTVDAAPWLGRNRMQEAPNVAVRPVQSSFREIHVEPWKVAAGAVGTVFVGAEVLAADQIIKGIRRKDPKQWTRGGLIAVSPSLLFCAIGPEISQLATPVVKTATPEVQVIASPTALTEILTATPAPSKPTEVASSTYPTEFSGGQPVGRYDYVGQEGRDAMVPILRAYYDRMIPELARDGYISGATVADQYKSFDQSGFSMRYFQNDQGQWTFIVYHPTHGYLVPTDVQNLPYSDLKLPYTMVFDRQERPLDQGWDNFGVKAFQADDVRFINGWPVLVVSSDGGEPTAAIDMSRGGVEVALQSTTSIPTEAPVSTATPEKITLNVSPDVQKQLDEQHALNPDGSVSSANKYVENASNFSVAPETIQHVATEDTSLKDILTGIDTQGHRVFWNKEKGYWVSEFGMGTIDNTPADSPSVPLDAYYDGSAHYSTAVYIAENPNLIAKDAAYPHYKAIIKYLSPEAKYFYLSIAKEDPQGTPQETQISYKVNKPFAYLGLQQTKDNSGNIIYVMVKDSWNPTAEHPNQTLPTYLGFDKASYENWAQFPLIFNFTSNKINMPGEIVPIIPAASITDVNQINYENQNMNPNVAHLQNAATINFFAEHGDIEAILNKVANGEHLTTSTNVASLNALPADLSNMILLPGVRSW